MGVVIASALQNSGLSSSTKSSDFVLRQAENKKFTSDSKSSFSIQNYSTRRFIPLALNHVGLRGAHFTATLKEFATQLVTRPEGCPLLKGPFALSHMGAFKKILHTWELASRGLFRPRMLPRLYGALTPSMHALPSLLLQDRS
jgi:hypothetical protein